MPESSHCNQGQHRQIAIRPGDRGNTEARKRGNRPGLGRHKLSGRGDLGGQLAALLGEGAEITIDLQTVPELGCLGEERAKPDRHRWGYGALAQHDLIDRAFLLPASAGPATGSW